MGRRLICVVLALGIPLSAVASADFERKTSPEAAKYSDSLRAALEGEIDSLKTHEWAGIYVKGDGRGESSSLWIAPKSGFLFEWYGCLGLYDRNYGSVTTDDGMLELNCVFENVEEGFAGTPTKLIPIQFGQRTYLIPNTKLVDFCEAINDESEPRRHILGRFYLRKGDEAKPAYGIPIAPDRYRAYLSTRPVEATIREVRLADDAANSALNGTVIWELVLDTEEQDQLLPGMKLRLLGQFAFAVVVRADSTAVYAVLEQSREGADPPKAGAKLSTSGFHLNEGIIKPR